MNSLSNKSTILLGLAALLPLESAFSQCCGGQSFSATGSGGGSSAGFASIRTDFGPRPRVLVEFNSPVDARLTRGDLWWDLKATGSTPKQLYLPQSSPALSQGSEGVTTTNSLSNTSGTPTAKTTTDTSKEKAEGECPPPEQAEIGTVPGLYLPGNPPSATTPTIPKEDRNPGKPGSSYQGNSGDPGKPPTPSGKDERGQGKPTFSITGGALKRETNGDVNSGAPIINIENHLGRDLRGYGSSGYMDVNPSTSIDLTDVDAYRHRGRAFGGSSFHTGLIVTATSATQTTITAPEGTVTLKEISGKLEISTTSGRVALLEKLASSASPDPMYSLGYKIVETCAGQPTKTTETWTGTHTTSPDTYVDGIVTISWGGTESMIEEFHSTHAANADERSVVTRKSYKVGTTTTILHERTDVVKLYSWGEQTIKTTLKTGGTDLVTDYTYWDPVDNSSPPQPDTGHPSYGTLKLQSNPDGSWVAYGRQGSDEYEIRPWKDTAAPASSLTLVQLMGLQDVEITTTSRSESPADGLVTTSMTQVNGITTGQSITTLNAARSLRVRQDIVSPASEENPANFFKTVTLLDTRRKPTNVYRLKENLTDHTIPANRISHTVYKHNSGISSNVYPYYSDDGTYQNSRSYDVTTVETDADVPAHFKTVSVVEVSTQRTLITERWITNNSGASWSLLEHREYTFDSRGRSLTTISKNSATATSITEESLTYPSDYVVARTDANGLLTTTTYDAFGRVISEIEDTSTIGSFWVPRRAVTHTYAPRAGDVPGVIVTTKEEAFNNGSNTVINYWMANAAGYSYVSGDWRRTSIAETDGAGRTVYAKDPVGIETFTTYSAGAPGTGTATVTEKFTSTGDAARTLQYYRDGRQKSESGNTVIARTYDYPMPTADFVSTETVVTAGSTAAATTTARDGLRRVVSVIAPSSATGTSAPYTPVLTTSVYTYAADGQVKAIQREGGSAGTYFQVFDRDLNARVTKSALSDNATWSSNDTNQRIETTTFEFDPEETGLWWQQTKVGPSPATPTDPDSYVSLTKVALGPWSGGATRMTGWTITSTSTGVLTSQKSYVTPGSRLGQVDTELNGAWQTKQFTLNGVPYQFQNPTLGAPITYVISPLRELLVEPSSQSIPWPRLSRSSTTGQILARSLPSGNSNNVPIELYTYFAGSTGAKGGLLATKSTNAATSPAVVPSSVTRYDYDLHGRLTNQWGGGAYPVAYTYDDEGRMITLSTYRTGNFNAVDWPGGAADTTTWVYAPGFAQPLEKDYPSDPVSNPNDKNLLYTYHANGSLATRVWQRDVSGSSTTTYGYDAYARLATVSYPDATPGVSYEYLATGQVARRTDGQETTDYTYLADGRPEDELTEGPLGVRGVFHFVDTLGRTSQLTAAWVNYEFSAMPNVTYTYDGSHRLATVSAQGVTAATDRHAVFSSYNTNGFPSTTAFKIGADPATAPTYLTRTIGTLDAEGRTPSINYSSGTTLQSFAYTYDRYHVKSITRENLNQWVYSYDEKMQVKQAKKLPTDAGYMGIYATALKGQDTTYNYDQIGNRTSVVENTYPSKTVSYTANALNQYSAVNNTGGKFDVSGYRSSSSANILIYQNSGSGQTPDYQSAGSAFHFWKRLTHSGTPPWGLIEVKENDTRIDYGYQFVPPATNTPTYDADGNLKTDARYTYTWDMENRLIGISWTAAQSPVNQAGSIAYTYDGLSRRITRKSIYIDSNNAPQIVDYTGYLYDGWNHIQTVRLNANDTVRGQVAAYVWGPDIGSRWTAGANWQAAGGVGGLLLVVDGNDTPTGYVSQTSDPTDDDYFPLMDRLGNVTAYKKAATTTPSTQLDAIYEYDAFGQEIRSTGIAADKVPYHFSTKFTDEQTGLNYYGYRWYDAGNGRWLGRDPIEEDGGENLYAIVKNETINVLDVLGLSNRPAWPKDCDDFAKENFLNNINRVYTDAEHAINQERLSRKPDKYFHEQYGYQALMTPDQRRQKHRDNSRGYWDQVNGECAAAKKAKELLDKCIKDNPCDALRLALDILNSLLNKCNNPQGGPQIGPAGSQHNSGFRESQYKREKYEREMESALRQRIGLPPNNVRIPERANNIIPLPVRPRTPLPIRIAK